MDHSKRKATGTPEHATADTRGNKSRKPNAPETAGPSVASNNADVSKGSELTQKLVAMWVGGAQGHAHPLMAQEVCENNV